MEQPSHLESFLNDLRSSGQTQGEGHFTVAREKALEKLAEFQLPFAGAWVVKAFQFFLAAGVDKPIAIQQTRRVTTLSCEAALAFTPEELEEAFFHPEPSGTRAIDHLMAALWAVGIKQRRSFEIQLANATRFVLWDGGKMHIVSCQPVPRSTLTFTHQSPESSTSWLLDQIAVSRANAEVAAAIRDHCYTSPVILTVDGRRVDGLHNCPQQGWSNRSFPLSLSFLHGDLPELQWPSGTFEAMQDSANRDMVDGGGLEGATRSLWKSLEKVRASGLALLVSAHAYPLTRSVDQQRPIGAWQLDTFPSRCHWVQDGAVVHIDPLLIPPLGVSAALFVSADGLENDLTRFQLRDAGRAHSPFP